MLVIGISTKNINAYDIPSSACYIHAKDRNLGDLYIYIPCNETTLFSYKDNQPVLVSSSNVTGYLSTTDDYTINFRPYYVGRYRNSTYGDYINLDIIQIYEDTNINVFSDSDQYINSNKNTIILSSLVFIGVILCLIFMKR